jgi:hypothetical protein
MSLAFTPREAFVSPTRTPIGTLTLPELFTPFRVMVIVCALVTPVRLTIAVVVPLPLLLPTLPAPELTAAPVKVTALGNVNTT